jgi:hypothetical protein
MTPNPLLAPVMALVLWSLVMWAWLYATRIPATMRFRVSLSPHQTKQQFDAQLPAEVRWKADNYNHLMEQPTIFYATALTLALLGSASLIDTTLAWIYVATRVVHSLVQATTNIVLVRFAIFNVSTVVLVLLAIRAAVRVVSAS